MKNLLYRCLLVLSKISLGCLLGCVMLLFYASYSPVVRQEIKKSVQAKFKDQFDCDWDGQVTSIDLIRLNMTLSNVSMFPCKQAQDWSLYAQSFHISASLFDFIVYRKFRCHGAFEHAVVHEKQGQDKSYFAQVLAKMFAGQVSDISFDYVTVKQGQFFAQDATGQGQCSYTYNCQMSCEQDGLHTKLYMLDGNCQYKDSIIFENMFGSFISIVPYNKDLQEVYARVDCRLSIPAMQEKGSCFLIGDLYRGRGACVVSNEDQSFIIEPLKIKLKQHSMPITCSISMDASVVQLLVAQQVMDSDLTGNITLTVMGNLLDLASSLQGKLQCSGLRYKNNSLIDQAYISFNKEDKGYSTKIFVDKKLLFQGHCKPTPEGFNFDIANVAQLQPWWTSYWMMPVEQGLIQGTVDLALYRLQTNYQFGLQSDKLDEKAKIDGLCTIDADQLSCSGVFLDKQYSSQVTFKPVPHLVQLRYFSSEESFLDFHEHQDPSQGTVGFVSFNCIKNLLPDEYKSSFSQPGQFDMQGNLHQGSYCAQVSAHNAHIRIPSLYNVVQDFTATMSFDLIGRSIVIDSMVAALYEGKIRCDHAIASFDNQSKATFLHIPLFLDNVLMRWKKGIFGIVSGRLFLSQQEHQNPLLQGNLIVDKAQLKGNIFSQDFQEQLVGAVDSSQAIDLGGDLDVTIQTKEPVAVETSFLQAKVHLDLHVGNTIKQPEIEGSIDVVSGELKFPYKSLFITHGQILIMPKSSTEPMIEFVAKGKIKRYDITMRATGTMMDQQINFESSPYLTEEQIISLLLIGSQDSSLSALMPAMFMQKLQEIIFGPEISKSKLDVLFNRLLQSFKNIRIIPQFTNQTGRGGVRGVIEVDATDRLLGRIDSNLMQLEDTIFEADYLLTDDVTMRAIKDGPSTYGGEVEMRWKFS